MNTLSSKSGDAATGASKGVAAAHAKSGSRGSHLEAHWRSGANASAAIGGGRAQRTPSVFVGDAPVEGILTGRAPNPILQRACRCGGASTPCSECQARRPLLQRASAGVGSTAAIPASVHDTLRSSGQPLGAPLRSFMESRYRHDFGSVRVHTDGRAAESARAVNALAYTVGRHIVFDQGQYRPETSTGRYLIAHELAHTLQQGGVQRFPTDSVSTESSQYRELERDADAAARHVLAAREEHAATPVVPRLLVGAAMLSRIPRDWQPLDEPLTITGHSVTERAQLDRNETNPASLAFKIDKLALPSEKGPVQALYQAKVEADALEATVRFGPGRADSAQAGLWQSRANTADLRRNWLLKVGWARFSPEEVRNSWYQAGGKMGDNASFPARNPAVESSRCDMDHIVELQLGGTNVPQNIQVLNWRENQAAGRLLWEQVRDLATGIRETLPNPKPREIILHFRGVEQVGGSLGCQAASGPGAAATCTEVECAVQAGVGGGGEAPASILEQYPVEAGGTAAMLLANPSPADTDLLSSTTENLAAAELIPGVILSVLHRPSRGRETIDGFIESTAYFKRSKATRVPLILAANQARLVFDVNQRSGRRLLSLRGSQHPTVHFTYPYMSTGDLRLSFDPATGLSGSGRLRPSLPLLRRAPMNVEFGQDRLRIFYGATRLPIQTPIPGVRLTEASLGLDVLPELRPSGRLSFSAGPARRELLTGSLEASADANGLVLDGRLQAHIPNTDQAEGEVHYRNREWSGFVVVGSSQIRIPGVQRGQLRVDFTNEGPVPSGSVELLVANQPITLEAAYRRGRFLFIGRGTFALPGLRPLTTMVETDGRYVNFEGRTGVALPYMNGDIAVRYRSGRWSGDGTVNVNHGRADGTANLHLSEAGRVFGDGRLAYRITDNLTAAVGIVLREDRSVRVSGDITLATIRLFDRFPRSGGRQRLFGTHIGVPILGFSLGPIGDVGLVLAIDPEVGVYYDIGPGELRNTRLTTAFDPFATDPNLTFSAGTQLNVPFDAGFYVSIPASLRLSAVIASVNAGLDTTADIGLRGAFDARADLNYAAGLWRLEALAGVYASPRLALRIDGFLRAEAGIGPFEKSAEKRWNLSRWEWGSAMRFGIEFPLHYASNEAFRAPSFGDIRFIYPQIDFTRLMRDIAGGAS